MSSRRKFLTDCGALASGIGFSYLTMGQHDWHEYTKKSAKNSGLFLRFKPYELHLKHVFTLAK